MVDNTLNILLAPQFVVNIVHEMGGAGGFTIVAGIASTGSGGGSMSDAQVKIAYENNPDTNAFQDAEKSKLALIEALATADQSDAEIRTAVEAATDSNVFTDADHSKLNAIEASATADQSNAEIKTAYELNTNTNAFTDAEQTKLAGVDTGAKDDQTGAEIKSLYQGEPNAFTDTKNTKLTGIETAATADQTGSEIKTAYELEANTNAFNDAAVTKLAGIDTGAKDDQTGAEIKTLYQGEANAYTDTKNTKLAGIEDNATADQTNTEIRTAVAAATDSNVFQDADVTKLDGIETSATADQTGAEIKTAYENEADTNAFTDALVEHYGVPLSTTIVLTALTEASLFDKERRFVEGEITDYFYDATAGSGDLAPDDQTGGTGFWLKVVASGDTAASIKTKYESNANTNEFDDAEQTKLAGIETAADVTDTTNVAAAGAIMDSDISTSEGFLRKTGAGAYEAIKTNLGAAVGPGVSDDSAAGYAVGSRWIDTTADKEYVCLNSGVGVAVWTETTGGGAMSDAEVKTAYENNADTNAHTDAQVTKLTGIETAAKDDQTGAEIKSLYQAEANAFTDTKNTKLTGIETSATADQTNAEIRTAVEAATDSNVFTDADHTKLGTIEDSATADQTGAEIKTAYELEANTNAYNDAAVTKLAGIATGADVSPTPLSDAQIKTQYELNADTNVHTDAQVTKLAGIDTGAKDDQTGAEIKTLYQSETNAYTDTKNTKLTGIETGATADQSNAEIRTAVGAATDSNVYTDAAVTKLAGVEALADVTDATNVDAAGAIMDGDVSAGEGFLRKTGAGAYEAIKSNLASAVNPGATDDAAAGYVVGSVWINTTGDAVFQCVDSTNAAAVWKDLSAGAAGGETNTASNGGGAGVGVWDAKSGVDLVFRNLVATNNHLTITLDDANNEIDFDIPFATTTSRGVSELATIAEVDGGTETGRLVTPFNLAGSALQTKVNGIEALADVTDTANVTAAGAAMLGGAGMTVGSTHFNVQTGTTYTLVAGDNGKTVTLNNAAAIVLTVPTGLGQGFRCTLLQVGAGQVTITASGTTLNSLSGNIKIAGQYGVGGLLATASNIFALAGDLVA